MRGYHAFERLVTPGLVPPRGFMTGPAQQRVGRFDILAPLGSGAMGVVYRARDTRLNREVAVKLLADRLTSDPDALGRFEREARAASSLNHPNIITVFDAGADGSTAYIVTELLQGATLRDRIARRPLPVDVALDLASQIAAGLSAAHAAGIVHRDVKPQNVFVTNPGLRHPRDARGRWPVRGRHRPGCGGGDSRRRPTTAPS
jgi:serine/threonine protein kinase